jgi:hypothetical protein
MQGTLLGTKVLTIFYTRYGRTANKHFVLENLNLVGSAIAGVDQNDACLPVLLGACRQALLDLSECSCSLYALEMALEILHTVADTARSSKAVGIIKRVLMQQTPAEALRHRFGAMGYAGNIAEA